LLESEPIGKEVTMHVLRLGKGPEVRFAEEVGQDPIEVLPEGLSASELLQSVQERLIREARAAEVEGFRKTASRAGDITKYELVEEWDPDRRVIRWYYRRR
jgi:hypothetical protein